MSLPSAASAALLSAGIGSVIAAIVGGGITYRGIKFPKILSQRRQLLLGGFGALLILTSLGSMPAFFKSIGVVLTALLPLSFPLVVLGFFLIAGMAATKREKKYKQMMRDHLHLPKQLIEDAETAFWQRHYEWAANYVSQARAAARDDTWERGYGFLLGAQLALGRKSAARNTRADIVNSLNKAATEKVGYFSSQENLRQLISNLTAVKMEVTKGNGLFSGSVRAEIDLVLEAAEQEIRRERST